MIIQNLDLILNLSEFNQPFPFIKPYNGFTRSHFEFTRDLLIGEV